MGCNCKKKYDVFKKYSDASSDEQEKSNIFWKILVSLCRIFIGILLAPLIIVIMLMFVLYVIVCIMIGVEPTINLKPFKKKGNGRKQNLQDTNKGWR
jgi:hypothetical protein